MAKQTEDDITTSGSGGVQMVKFKGFLGRGAAKTGDDEVTLGILTGGISLDISMTVEEAKLVAKRLREAAN